MMTAVQGPWGVWSALVGAGAFGLWAEKNTKIGKELSGALVATLAGMALANLGVLPQHAPEMNTVYKFLLPLAIPMLLYSADLKRVLTETGRLLLAFLLGSVMTVIGSAVAMSIFPLGSYLGDAGWKIASALTARHIGGAVNYMAVSDMLQIPPSVFGAGLAADDLILTFYFTTIYSLASKIPSDVLPGQRKESNEVIDQNETKSSSSPSQQSEASTIDRTTGTSTSEAYVDSQQAQSVSLKQDITANSPASTNSASAAQQQPVHPPTASAGTATNSQDMSSAAVNTTHSQPSSSSTSSGGHGHGGSRKSIQVSEGLQAVALSTLICYAATTAATALQAPGQSLTFITGITVALATLAPRALSPIVPSAEGLAQILMQVFYATIGASANIGLVVKTAPVLFVFCALALGLHLGLLLWVGKMLGFSRKELLIASNANIGGPSTVAGMCAAKGWTSAIVPGILTSTLGYAVGTFIGTGLGFNFLKHM